MTCATAILVYHSGPERARRALESLEAQDLGDLRVILVDHSPAGEGGKLAARFHRVDLLRPETNLGFGGGVAYALARDDAPIVLLLNPDAVAEPAWARRVVEALADDASAGAAAVRVRAGATAAPGSAGGGDGRETGGTGAVGAIDRLDSAGLAVTRGGMGILRGHRASLDTPRETLDRVPLLGPSGAAAAYRRSALEAIGGFPTVYFLYYEDLEIAWRLRRAGWTPAWVDDALVTHDHVSGAGAEKLYYLHRARRLFLLRNWPGARAGGWSGRMEEAVSWARAATRGRLGDARRARLDAERLHLAHPSRPADPDRPVDPAWFAPAGEPFRAAARKGR